MLSLSDPQELLTSTILDPNTSLGIQEMSFAMFSEQSLMLKELLSVSDNEWELDLFSILQKHSTHLTSVIKRL